MSKKKEFKNSEWPSPSRGRKRKPIQFQDDQDFLDQLSAKPWFSFRWVSIIFAVFMTLATLLYLVSVRRSFKYVEVGMTSAEVIEIMGRPKRQLTRGDDAWEFQWSTRHGSRGREYFLTYKVFLTGDRVTFKSVEDSRDAFQRAMANHQR